MPFVRIDHTVIAFLREHRRVGDTYNDTVRTLLGLPPAPPVTSSTDVTMPGALMPLITAGTLTAGDTVTWHRRRRGEIHTATVDDAGRMVIADGAVFLTPDTCASAIAGYPCKGWPNRRTAAGETLQQLRDRPEVALPRRNRSRYRVATEAAPLPPTEGDNSEGSGGSSRAAGAAPRATSYFADRITGRVRTGDATRTAATVWTSTTRQAACRPVARGRVIRAGRDDLTFIESQASI